jgi:hypothetical protein
MVWNIYRYHEIYFYNISIWYYNIDTFLYNFGQSLESLTYDNPKTSFFYRGEGVIRSIKYYKTAHAEKTNCTAHWREESIKSNWQCGATDANDELSIRGCLDPFESPD